MTYGGRVSACIVDESLGASRMIVEEARNVVDLAAVHDPHVVRELVLAHFVYRILRHLYGNSLSFLRWFVAEESSMA